jgi:diguanylate cyclase (GGDEF)-like protein
MTSTPGDSPERRARGRFDWAVERLLHGTRPHRARRLAARERRVEAAAAALFLLAAGGLAVLVPSVRSFSPGVALGLAVGYALASRVRLYVGAGYTMPTQLVLVPMLFWLPVATVPLLVSAALVGVAGIDVARGRAHPERAITTVADAWYAVGPSVVLLLAGEPAAADVAWEVVALALVAQCLVDLLASAVREWLGRGIPPALQLRVIGSVYLIDVCLTPVAVVVASAGGALHVAAIVAIAPLLGVLAAFALDRRARIDELTNRLDELREERRRHVASIRRVGEASGAGLDRPALLEVVLRTALEALDADGGRARVADSRAAVAPGAPVAERLERALAAAEGEARSTGRPAAVARESSFALAHPLAREAAPAADVMVVGRNGRPFGDEEQALFGYLAAQMSVAMENVDLHERVAREARVDELTGLANHRHFQEALAVETERLRRFRRSLALVMVDVDHFKAVNDTHGHQQGDAVLRHVAGAIRDCSRSIDTAARYGGEELAVVLPDTDLEGAFAAGEKIRRAVEALRVPRPGGPPLHVTVSVGVAAVTATPVGPATLVAAADAALYEAKRGGRNQTVRAAATAPARLARQAAAGTGE